MEQRISVVTLGVADLERSRAFYERLGWKRSVERAEGVAFFQAGGMALALYPRVDVVRDAAITDDGRGFHGMTLAYNTRSRAEVEAVLAEAHAAGATLLNPPREVFWGGYIGYFADPDGFVWEVAWNPGFPMAPDGAITLPD
ncbi:MAG: uncharacterized protein QOK29_2310 [Rhodospirillaceae bacterium]|jgi:catechol 2,3-dioxygenase-like lactoylglutathione lyase family enzyme|nr:uncharacterized protein [Rhodospirillaceae bacterium]